MDSLFNFSYSADLFNNLTVYDPQDVQIYLSVEGQPTVYPSGTYNDGNPPVSFNQNDLIHLQARVRQSGIWVNTSGTTVNVYDDIDNVLLGYYTYTGLESMTGLALINITSSGFHSGLYRLRVQYQSYDAINMTYIIMNGSFTIGSSESYLEYQRGIIQNDVLTAIISSAGSGTIEGLRINLTMLDSNYIDVTSLYLNLQGTQPITVFNSQGSFIINSLSLDCPYGIFYLRIDFNGSLQDDWLSLNNFMNSNSSILITLNVTASTTLIELSWYTSYEAVPNLWVYGTTLYVNGLLTYDNGSAIIGVNVLVSVQFLNSTLITSNYFVTNSTGGFSATFLIGSTWPTYRNQTEIWVYYTPVQVNVQGDQLEFTDW